MSIKFNFASFATRRKDPKTRYKEFTTVAKKVEGIVYITLNAEYFVLVDGQGYKFTLESYEIKPNSKFYAQCLIDNKRMCIQELNNKRIGDKTKYLPFAPGITAIGDLIKDNKQGVTLFKLRDTYNNPNAIGAKDAINYFRHNYDIIRENMLNGNI